LLVELGKEHLKLTAKADKLRKADPSVSFHFHHAVGNAISSLSASKKPISSAEDLKNIKGFGPHVLSLARTCLHRIWAADPLLSPRPRRPRVKSMTRTYTPRVGSQAFAVMCIARRHDGITMQDFARFNDDYGYSSTPFVQGPKGWAAQPMAQLCEKGLMVGSFESGWTLTDSGEEIADRALHKWDTSAEEPEEDDDDDNGDDENSARGKEEKKDDKKDTKISSTGKSKKTRKRADSDDFSATSRFWIMLMALRRRSLRSLASRKSRRPPRPLAPARCLLLLLHRLPPSLRLRAPARRLLLQGVELMKRK